MNKEKQNINNLRRRLEKETDPRKQIYTLLKLAKERSRSNIEESIQYAKTSIAISKKYNIDEALAESFAMIAIFYRQRGDMASCKKYLGRALKIYQKKRDTDAVNDIEFELYGLDLSQEKTKDAILRLHRLLEVTSKMPDGVVRNWQDRVLNTLPSIKKSRSNLLVKHSNVLYLLGTAYQYLGNSEKSLEILDDALKTAEKLEDRVRIRRLLNNRGVILGNLGNTAIAIRILSSCLKRNRLDNDNFGSAINLLNIGDIYFRTGKTKEGKKYSLRAFEIFNEGGFWKHAALALYSIADFERKKGLLSKAVETNLKSRMLLSGKEESIVYFRLFFQQLQIEYARTKTKEIYDSLVLLFGIVTEKHYDLDYEIAQELAQIAEELSLFPDSVDWLKRVHSYQIKRIGLEQKKLIDNLEISFKLEKMEKEKVLYKSKMSQLQNDLKSKSLETELLATQLAKKGSFLASLTDYLSSLNKESNQYSKETIDEVIKYIDSVRHKDNEFERLEERANALYHDFIVSLSKRYPTLTQTERKICLLHILGLGTQDIANVLFTSVRTVETQSFSIRKKMKIPKNTRLAPFLNSLKKT